MYAMLLSTAQYSVVLWPAYEYYVQGASQHFAQLRTVISAYSCWLQADAFLLYEYISHNLNRLYY